MATRNPEASCAKTQGQSGGLFFTSLQMVHWRNFQGQKEMLLAARVFLLGPNASGKSNVLDALRFLMKAGTGIFTFTLPTGASVQPGRMNGPSLRRNPAPRWPALVPDGERRASAAGGAGTGLAHGTGQPIAHAHGSSVSQLATAVVDHNPCT